MLTRDQLFGSFQRRYRTVPTPLGDARIQNLNEDELSEFYRGQVNAKGELDERYQLSRRRRLVAACLVDDEGRRLLTQPGDIARLGPSADSALITTLFLACLDHCGLQKVEAETEGLEKNSGAAPGTDSPTA